jgi:hypothetical protein
MRREETLKIVICNSGAIVHVRLNEFFLGGKAFFPFRKIPGICPVMISRNEKDIPLELFENSHLRCDAFVGMLVILSLDETIGINIISKKNHCTVRFVLQLIGDNAEVGI